MMTADFDPVLVRCSGLLSAAWWRKTNAKEIENPVSSVTNQSLQKKKKKRLPVVTMDKNTRPDGDESPPERFKKPCQHSQEGNFCNDGEATGNDA